MLVVVSSAKGDLPKTYYEYILFICRMHFIFLKQ